MASSKSLRLWLKTSLGGNSRTRSENGGEYVKSEFIQYCEDAGIQMQNSIPYTPHQNGVAERKNRSLKEMATYMLEAKTLPPIFLAKAINYASYIQNRVPHK